jgi:hypothetical protein
VALLGPVAGEDKSIYLSIKSDNMPINVDLQCVRHRHTSPPRPNFLPIGLDKDDIYLSQKLACEVQCSIA